MLNQDIALDFSYTVFGAILRKNLPTFLKINTPGVLRCGYFADQAQLMRERVLRKQTTRMQKACCCLAVCHVPSEDGFRVCRSSQSIYSSSYLILQESPTLILLECGSWFRQCLPSTLRLRHSNSRFFLAFERLPWHDL